MNDFGITKEEIIELAAQKLADQYAEMDDLEKETTKKIDARINLLLSTSLEQKVGAFLDTEMARILSTEITPVDIWGEKQGQPTTIKAMLAIRAKEYWVTKVDSNGKADGGYYGKPRHEYLFNRVVHDEFAKAIQQNIVNIVAAFKDALAEDSKYKTQEYINDLIKVTSLRDKKS